MYLSSTLYNDDQEEKLLMRPKCSNCGEHIQEEYCIELPNGEILCEDCEFENARDLWMQFGRPDFVKEI